MVFRASSPFFSAPSLGPFDETSNSSKRSGSGRCWGREGAGREGGGSISNLARARARVCVCSREHRGVSAVFAYRLARNDRSRYWIDSYGHQAALPAYAPTRCPASGVGILRSPLVDCCGIVGNGCYVIELSQLNPIASELLRREFAKKNDNSARRQARANEPRFNGNAQHFGVSIVVL